MQFVKLINIETLFSSVYSGIFFLPPSSNNHQTSMVPFPCFFLNWVLASTSFWLNSPTCIDWTVLILLSVMKEKVILFFTCHLRQQTITSLLRKMEVLSICVCLYVLFWAVIPGMKPRASQLKGVFYLWVTSLSLLILLHVNRSSENG